MAIRKECVISLADVSYLEVECPNCQSQAKLTLEKSNHIVLSSCQKCGTHYPSYLTESVQQMAVILFSTKHFEAIKSISLVSKED